MDAGPHVNQLLEWVIFKQENGLWINKWIELEVGCTIKLIDFSAIDWFQIDWYKWLIFAKASSDINWLIVPNWLMLSANFKSILSVYKSI